MADRLVWWGTCDKCLTTMTVSPHPEREPLPEQSGVDEFWEDAMPSCPVCGQAYIRLDSSDPVKGFRLE